MVIGTREGQGMCPLNSICLTVFRSRHRIRHGVHGSAGACGPAGHGRWPLPRQHVLPRRSYSSDTVPCRDRVAAAVHVAGELLRRSWPLRCAGHVGPALHSGKM